MSEKQPPPAQYNSADPAAPDDQPEHPGDAADSAQALHIGFLRSGMSTSELWANYVSMGGHLTEQQLLDAMRDGHEIGSHDHDMAAQALNEHFIDVGLDHLVPYYYQLGQKRD